MTSWDSALCAAVPGVYQSLSGCLHFETVLLALRTLSLQGSRHVVHALRGF